MTDGNLTYIEKCTLQSVTGIDINATFYFDSRFGTEVSESKLGYVNKTISSFKAYPVKNVMGVMHFDNTFVVTVVLYNDTIEYIEVKYYDFDKSFVSRLYDPRIIIPAILEHKDCEAFLRESGHPKFIPDFIPEYDRPNYKPVTRSTSNNNDRATGIEYDLTNDQDWYKKYMQSIHGVNTRDNKYASDEKYIHEKDRYIDKYAIRDGDKYIPGYEESYIIRGNEVIVIPENLDVLDNFDNNVVDNDVVDNDVVDNDVVNIGDMNVFPERKHVKKVEPARPKNTNTQSSSNGVQMSPSNKNRISYVDKITNMDKIVNIDRITNIDQVVNAEQKSSSRVQELNSRVQEPNSDTDECDSCCDEGLTFGHSKPRKVDEAFDVAYENEYKIIDEPAENGDAEINIDLAVKKTLEAINDKQPISMSPKRKRLTDNPRVTFNDQDFKLDAEQLRRAMLIEQERETRIRMIRMLLTPIEGLDQLHGVSIPILPIRDDNLMND